MTLTPEQRRKKMGAVIRAGSGNFLELYDFLVYVYFTPYIAKAYFPANDPYMSLILAFGAYGVSAVARPFGAVILGSYMDRVGRRAGLILTLSLMAVGTFTLAFTPSYATIGLAAPIIITIGRLIQGFSLGVEAGGVNVYLAEIATAANRGFYCAWQASSQALGVVIATGLGVLLTATLTTEQMDAWGWRIPLIVGCLIIPVLMWLRRSLEETEVFERSEKPRSTGEILSILLEHWYIVAICVGLTILNTTTFYLVNGYTPTYGNQTLHLTPLASFTVALTVSIATFILVPVGGALSDRIGRWPMVTGVPLLVIATSYPAMLWLVDGPSFTRLLIVSLWLAFLYAMYAGALVPLVTELLPPKVRSSGYAIILSFANGFFGGFTPLIATFLIEQTNDRASPTLWITAAAALSILAGFAARRFALRPRLHTAPAE